MREWTELHGQGKPALQQYWVIAQSHLTVSNLVYHIFSHCALPSCVPVFFVQGLRNWCEFSEIFYGSSDRGFPPTSEGLLCWSHTFRCVGTFSNYLGYLRNACLALGISAPPVDDPLLRRAKGAIVKRMVHSPRHGISVLHFLHAAASICYVLAFLGHACSYSGH